MKFKQAFKKTSIALCIAFVVGAGLIVWTGLKDKVVTADLAVVPGNTVNPDGKPHPRLQGRLDAALGLYRAGRCKWILVSGGIGSEGFDEAKVMQEYLISNGVPAGAIFTDNHGINTFETARFTANLVREKKFGPPILVSQYFHIARFRLAMRKFGVQSAGNVHAQYFEAKDVYSIVREVAGYIKYSFMRPQAT